MTARAKICPLSEEGCQDGRCKINGPCAREIDAKAREAAERAAPRHYFPMRMPTSRASATLETYRRLKDERDTQLLARVVAPHFVAGIIIQGSRCVEAAPVLAWIVGHDRDWLRIQFSRRGWKASIVPDHAR